MQSQGCNVSDEARRLNEFHDLSDPHRRIVWIETNEWTAGLDNSHQRFDLRMAVFEHHGYRFAGRDVAQPVRDLITLPVQFSVTQDLSVKRDRRRFRVR